MAGSIRQRGRNSWQIRVYAGTDPVRTSTPSGPTAII